MICFICKQSVQETALICPNCGAMPWKMPAAFLGPEQHKAWLTEVYEPQLMRWNQVLQREKRIKELSEENERLRQEIRRLKDKSNAVQRSTFFSSYHPNTTTSKPKPPVPDGLTLTTDDFVIQNGNLSKCRRAISIANIPNGVTSIGTSCFAECKSLIKVSIPKSVGTIGFWAFDKCDKLSDLNLPEGITVIGGFSFYGCVSLRQLILPQSLNYIGDSAFANCKSLTEVTIPSNVTNLGKVAFAGCDHLRIAKVPAKLSVPDNCFPMSCEVIQY